MGSDGSGGRRVAGPALRPPGQTVSGHRRGCDGVSKKRTRQLTGCHRFPRGCVHTCAFVCNEGHIHGYAGCPCGWGGEEGQTFPQLCCGGHPVELCFALLIKAKQVTDSLHFSSSPLLCQKFLVSHLELNEVTGSEACGLFVEGPLWGEGSFLGMSPWWPGQQVRPRAAVPVPLGTR